jgi:hypothetical protein
MALDREREREGERGTEDDVRTLSKDSAQAIAGLEGWARHHIRIRCCSALVRPFLTKTKGPRFSASVKIDLFMQSFAAHHSPPRVPSGTRLSQPGFF